MRVPYKGATYPERDHRPIYTFHRGWVARFSRLFWPKGVKIVKVVKIMNRDDDPELWDLLGRARELKVSPFFARNVVREVRGLDSKTRRVRWLSLRRLLPAASVAAVFAALFLLQLQTSVDPVRETEADMFVNVDPQDYDVIVDLDDVAASDESISLEESILH